MWDFSSGLLSFKVSSDLGNLNSAVIHIFLLK